MPSVAISATSGGNNTLVEAVPGKKICVTGYHLVANAAMTLKFQSGVDGKDLTGAMPVAANGPLTVPDTGSQDGWFKTAPGASLNLVLERDGDVGVHGFLNYRLIG